MADFKIMLVLNRILLLGILPACSAFLLDKNYCTNNSFINTNTTPEGKIAFPLTLNYTGKRCHALIHSPLEGRTELTLVNLRRQKPRKQCLEESLEIYTGLNNYNTSTFCKSVGSVEKIVLTSTIRIVYRAPFQNEVEQNRRKDAVYRDAITVNYKRLQPTKACRHLLTSKNGNFQSVGYPNDLQRGECVWVINTGKGNGITLKFDILYIHRLNCDNNFIEVRRGESGDAPEWVKICKQYDPIKIKSFSTKLWIRVKSSDTSGIGFQATYTTENCMVTKVYKQLNFQSPLMSCQTWNLTAPPGHIAALSFSTMNLVSGDSASCMDNFIEVWDGKVTNRYCNLNHPPSVILSKGEMIVVTYHSKTYGGQTLFQASFTSIFPSNYKANCFINDRKLSFKCNNQQIILCKWQCDGTMQCSDNSDEEPCADISEKWHRLRVFVIVIGSICASTVLFCIGLICFRKCLINDGTPSSAQNNRHLSITDQSPLTPNADLPSPPPGYFTDREEETPATVIRGTYFFGDEFSQGGIHNASLFGIPPPRYRSTESLHLSNSETRSLWQRGMSSIPLVHTDSSITNLIPEEDPPGYESISADKDEQIDMATQNNEMPTEDQESSPNDCNNLEVAIELQQYRLERLHQTSEITVDNQYPDIGVTNAGATLNV